MSASDSLIALPCAWQQWPCFEWLLNLATLKQEQELCIRLALEVASDRMHRVTDRAKLIDASTALLQNVAAAISTCWR